MTLSGWLLFAVAWGSITIAFIYCFAKILLNENNNSK